MTQEQNPKPAYEPGLVAILAEAQQLVKSGDTGAARVRLREAGSVVREADEQTRREEGFHYARDLQWLGTIFHTLGDWEIMGGDYVAAIGALNEAEDAWSKLLQIGPDESLENVPQQIVNVLIDRARANQMAGRLLSAATDAQQAVFTTMELYSDYLMSSPGGEVGSKELKQEIDITNVVSWAAGVQLSVGGDPELAGAAAGWAVERYMRLRSAAEEIILSPQVARQVTVAARVSCAVHTAFGREDLADRAKSLGRLVTGAPYEPDPTLISAVGMAPTLVKVIDAMDRQDLAERFASPEDAALVFVPVDRINLKSVASDAAALTDLQIAADDEFSKYLLGLEAHAMFAAGLQGDVPAMTEKFNYYGQLWATSVLIWGQYALASPQAALDAARWLKTITVRLMPHALVETEARSTAIDALRWQSARFTEADDQESMAEVSQMLAALQDE